MIVQCESCQSKFNLDEALIKEKGSKVRCSVCKNIFTVYPPEPEVVDEQVMIQDMEEELEETVALDSPPAFDRENEQPSVSAERTTTDFDQAFQEAIEEEELTEAALDQSLGGEDAGIGKVLGQAEKIAKDTGRRDKKKKREKGEKSAEAISAKAKASRSPKRLLIVLLIIFFLILVAAVIYFFFPNYIPGFLSSQKPVPAEILADRGVKNLTFKEVSGSFVQSEVAGQRFIVKGKVLNNYPNSRSYILVKAEILDEKGQVIRRKLAYTGNVFTENEIKNMPMTEIDKILKNRTGRNNMNLNIKPKADVPFMIIFENLPQNLSEFSVEAVSSSPGA